MMKNGARALAIAIVTLFFPFSVRAEETASNLPQLLSEAAAKNPQVRAAERRWKAAQQRVPQSWALEDPMFGFSVGKMMNPSIETVVGPETDFFAVSQGIPFPLKLYEKYRMAKAEAQAARQELSATQRDVAAQVKKVYFELCWNDASIAVLYEMKALLQKVESVAQSRYTSGKGTQRDVAKAQVDLSMVFEKIYLFEQQRKSKIADLNRVLNRISTTENEISFSAQLSAPQFKRTLDELLVKARENNPEILQLGREELKQKEGVKLAALTYTPDMKFDYNYTVIGNGETNLPADGKDAQMVMLSFSIPLWFQKNNAAIAESHQMWRETQEKLQEGKNKAQYEIRDAFARTTSAMQMVNLYSSSTLPQAQLALQSDMSGYEAGTGDFLNLLDSSRIYLDSKLNYLKAVLDALTALADLEKSAGVDFSKEEWGLK